jgi:fructoselysine-6-P-deglycase FrlB-like protein
MGPGYDGRPGLAEANKELALAIGELSNIATEAITMLEALRHGPLCLAPDEKIHVVALRKRLEAACRFVS